MTQSYSNGSDQTPSVEPLPLGESAPAPTLRDPSLALYQQIKDYLCRKILDGSWKPGDRLPSENELVVEFGISRMTVNRALRELAGEGKIVRRAGLGSFVAETRPQSTLLQIANLASEIQARGHSYRCDILLNVREAATTEVSTALQLGSGAGVFHTLSVHWENDVPVQIENRFVNPKAAPDYANQDFKALKPTEYLLRHVPFDEIEQVVEAVMPTPEQATQLMIHVDQPCLLLTRRTWTKGMPVTMVRCLHPSTRYRLGGRYKVEGSPLSS